MRNLTLLVEPNQTQGSLGSGSASDCVKLFCTVREMNLYLDIFLTYTTLIYIDLKTTKINYFLMMKPIHGHNTSKKQKGVKSRLFQLVLWLTADIIIIQSLLVYFRCKQTFVNGNYEWNLAILCGCFYAFRHHDHGAENSCFYVNMTSFFILLLTWHFMVRSWVCEETEHRFGKK